MKLKTRTFILASVALAFSVLVVGVIVWQVDQRPIPANNSRATTETRLGSSSGMVTQAPAPSQASVQTSKAAGAMPPVASASAVKTPPSASASAKANANASDTVKHRIVPNAAVQPPILPNEVNAAVSKALGGKNILQRLFYLEPLARRFVASVDGLGNQVAPTDLWLLKPAPGEIKLVASTKQPEAQLIKRTNSQRYSSFVQWLVRTDNAKLLTLYARLYPLLQQTYVDLGHPEGYFNDRVIEVIDLMLATPSARPPLRVQRAESGGRPTDRPASALQHPRYEFSDPALESLATGQKLMLRIGQQNAALLKLKLKALRVGLIKLGQHPRKG